MPVHIGVLNGGSVVYVAKAPAPGIIQFDTYPGKLAPFNLTALGRAIAAHVPPEQLQELLRHLTPGRGPRAGASGADPFVAVLEEVRRRGWALELEEEEADIACIAAPFFGSDGRVAGSVGVTGFVKDLATARQQRAAGSAMVELAGVISAKLGFHEGVRA
jgi:DNA-binding IclR family transcriptional regulator